MSEISLRRKGILSQEGQVSPVNFGKALHLCSAPPGIRYKLAFAPPTDDVSGTTIQGAWRHYQ